MNSGGGGVCVCVCVCVLRLSGIQSGFKYFESNAAGIERGEGYIDKKSSPQKGLGPRFEIMLRLGSEIRRTLSLKSWH
jgi:hypothetical protein